MNTVSTITKADAMRRFRPGDFVNITNHYITRPDHPCFGTNLREVTRVSTAGLTTSVGGFIPWPKASQIALDDGGALLLYGHPTPEALFLTISELSR